MNVRRATIRFAVVGCLVHLAAGTAPAAGQDADLRVRRVQTGGWIGVSYQPVGAPGQTGVRVASVQPGSPAHEVGLRAGDVIVSLDGRPARVDRLDELRRSLQPGERLSLTVSRDGQEQRIVLSAGIRPAAEVLVRLSPLNRVRLDSAHVAFMQHFDTASSRPRRFVYALGEGERTGVVVSGTLERAAGDSSFGGRIAVESSAFEGTLTLEVRAFDFQRLEPSGELEELLFLGAPDVPDPTLRVPLGPLVSRDGSVTTLRERMEALERELQIARLQEGASRLRADDDRLLPERERQAWVRSETERLRDRMDVIIEEARERGAGRGGGPPRVVRLRELASSRDAPGQEDRAVWTVAQHKRPLAPYIMGRDRVAGARFAFAGDQTADSGLLVLEVAEGTPAADAQLRPGDVLVNLGDVRIGSLDQLRRLYAERATAGPIPLTVVRRGDRLHLVVPH